MPGVDVGAGLVEGWELPAGCNDAGRSILGERKEMKPRNGIKIENEVKSKGREARHYRARAIWDGPGRGVGR